MAKEVIMPALGMAQETGVLLQWFKEEGESVTQGELMMEIETDKATVEVEAPASGKLVNITAQPGDEIPVGQPIAMILSPGEAAPEPVTQPDSQPSAEPDRTAPPVSPTDIRVATEPATSLTQSNGRVLASPKARRLAREQGLDPATIAGSGPEGAVLAADVMAAVNVAQSSEVPSIVEPVETPAALAPPAGQEVPVSRMWRVMAQRLTESWKTVPHFYLEREANASQLLTWWHTSMERVSDQVTLTDLLVKVVATALGEHPRANACWHNDHIILNEAVNVGLAVAVDEGLLVPVIHQADQLDLRAISDRRQEIVTRSRSGKVQPDDLQGGTFTISNLGMFGIDAFNAIVNPPQAAILAIGRIADRVVPVDGKPCVQPMMTLTLSCDHRVVDGATGAKFLQTVVRFIEAPLDMLLN